MNTDAFSGPSDPAGSHFLKVPAWARIVAICLAAAAGVVFAAWALTRYVHRRAEEQAALPPRPEGVIPAPPQAGFMYIRVMVRVIERGETLAIGAKLGKQVALHLSGKNGQPYEAGFDRVGEWRMEVPPGEYRAPAEQPKLKGWTWKLSGDGVVEAKGGGGYVLTFKEDRPGPGVDLLLMR